LFNLQAYQGWLEQEGADSFFLPKSFEGNELETLFQSMNGFLIPGGAGSLSKSAHAMVERAVKANNAGDYFPVWGTCLGFEWLIEIFGGKMTHGWDSEDLPGPISITESGKKSRIYASFDTSLLVALQSENISYNMHKQGISPQSAEGNAKLMEVFKVVSTEPDRKGKTFVAQIEGKVLPIYGNQFHPEKIQFVNSSSGEGPIPRTPHAVAGARHLAKFFVSEARKNTHCNATEVVVV
jgi:gamma-glutamyl hydrolase